MREHRVLIVEDEPRMRDLLLRALAEMGFTAIAARSGKEALRLMESQPPDIVLLDLNLPGMSGMDLFERARQARPDVQVVVLTGYGDLAAAQRAMRLDGVDFLTKPAPLGELEKALDRARRRVDAVGAERRPGICGEGDARGEEEEALADAGVAGPAGEGTLEAMERRHILAALARHQQNRHAAAAELGISLRTLYYRLAEYQKGGTADPAAKEPATRPRGH